MCLSSIPPKVMLPPSSSSLVPSDLFNHTPITGSATKPWSTALKNGGTTSIFYL